MLDPVIMGPKALPSTAIREKVDDFCKDFRPFELEAGGRVYLFCDEKSGAFYVTCHLQGEILSQHCDTEAALDGGEEDEIYKLNRDVQENQPAYLAMEHDARKGRSFEDLVLEYDTSYRSRKPLKVYGGQHRLKAITATQPQKDTVLHGVRVYFGLSRDQKVEIATINNTVITVAHDLLDRMNEQSLGPELRDWCQRTGLLEQRTDFSDRRSPEVLTGSPEVLTVRLARTLVMNFHRGKQAKQIDEFHQPVLSKSGILDQDYGKIRQQINWEDADLLEMGKEFARLHKVQRESVSGRETDDYAEYARKALSLAVVASWAYAAGLFQKEPSYLKNLYALCNKLPVGEDPLNAKALSKACLKGTDPETYRGLGTRSSPGELGRMLEVFLVMAEKDKKITKDLANAAIKRYEAKKFTYEANKAVGRI